MRLTHSDATLLTVKPNLELQQLHQFIVLSQHKNFTHASKALALSQSALSRSIQKLEEQLGHPLFERKPKSLELTEAGTTLLAQAQEILNLVDHTTDLLTERARRGRIRLGAIPTIAPYFLPSLLKGFAQLHPNISIGIQEATTESLLQSTQQGELDLALLAHPISSSTLHIESLFTEELYLVLPQKHPLHKRKHITSHNLEKYSFLTLNDAHCLSENIKSYCQQHALRPLSTERISQLTTIQELVALGHGISIIPHMAKKLDHSKRRVYRSITSQTAPQRTVCMAWNPHAPQNLHLEALKSHLKETYQNTHEPQ